MRTMKCAASWVDRSVPEWANLFLDSNGRRGCQGVAQRRKERQKEAQAQKSDFKGLQTTMAPRVRCADFDMHDAPTTRGFAAQCSLNKVHMF